MCMPEPQAVASRYAERRRLWKAAIKWPMYSVAVMPVLLAAGWRIGALGSLRWTQLCGFLLAAILLLLWENLSNDVFDAETGVDATGKPHSVVNLTGRSDRVAQWSLVALGLGLVLMIGLAWSSSAAVFGLVLLCCGLGYVYQGPPFRLGYRGLGEPLCWLAFGPCATAAALLGRGQPLYLTIYISMIVFFAFFYTAIVFNPAETAENLRKYGGFIPGIRPGKNTADYLDYVLTRLTAPGSLYLGLIAVLPVFAFGGLGVAGDFIFGGTSLLIMVGVGLDTVKQIESQLQQRNYEGFLG